MSDQNKKSWTFVPERSRPPPNRRATKRQTTVRSFTFVQDWSPRISPIPALNSSTTKQSSSRVSSQPSSQSSDGVRGESPLAQLVRSSPRPIIVARRSPAPRITPFKTPYSPSSSITSQDSVRSRQKSTTKRLARKNRKESARKGPSSQSTDSSGKTGVDPALSPSRSRQRHGSGSTTRSPVSGETGRRTKRHGQESSVTENGDVGDVSRVSPPLGDPNLSPSRSRQRHGSGSTTRSSGSVESGRRTERRGQESNVAENGDVGDVSRVSPPLGDDDAEGSDEASGRDTNRTAHSEKSSSYRIPPMDTPRTPGDWLDALEPWSDRSARSTSSVSSSRRKRKKKQNLLTFPKKSAKKGIMQTPTGDRSLSNASSIQDSNRSGTLGNDIGTIVEEDRPAERSVPRDRSRTELYEESPSSLASSTKRSTSTRKMRQSSLTFKKKGQTPRSAPRDMTSSREVRGQSSSGSDKDSDNVSMTVQLDETSSSIRSTKRSTSSRKKRGSSTSLTFRKKRHTPRSASKNVTSSREVSGQSSSGSDKDSDNVSMTVQLDETSSSISSTKRSTSSRKKRGPSTSLTFRKKKQTPRSAPKNVTSSREVRGQISSASDKDSESVSSSQRSTARRKLKVSQRQSPSGQTPRQQDAAPASKKGSAGKNIPRQTPRTPGNKSMSFIAVTPKSGHVSRPQSRVNAAKPGPGKTKVAGQARKRPSESHSSGTDDEATETRAKVRLWTTGARPRLVGDTTDLDILLNSLEDTTKEFRRAVETSSQKRSVVRFLDEARKNLTSMISSQQEFKMQSLVLSRTNSSIRKYRQQLLNLQKNNTRLDAQIAVAKKIRAKADDAESRREESFVPFLSDLQDLHTNYASKYPKDTKSVKSAPTLQPHNTRAAAARLKSSLESTSTLKSLNDRLQSWLDTH